MATLNIYQKISRYCAYRERSEEEVVQKLKQLGATGNDIRQNLLLLKAENFIDNNRFAFAFVRGKFNNNKWGRLKIKAALQQKGVDKAIIAEALQQIDEHEYSATLRRVLAKKAALIKAETPAKARASLMRFAYSKGFEPGLISAQLASLKF